jgi:hypothetical protein
VTVLEEKELVVWTNGNAIRKYQGQDKCMSEYRRSLSKWYKATAIIKPIKEGK